MNAKLSILFAAALLSACAAFDEERPTAQSRAGIDEQPSPALVAALARSQGLPQNQAEGAADAGPSSTQLRGARRGRGRAVRARQVRSRAAAAPAEAQAQ